MKHTTKLPRKLPVTPAKMGLLAAASAIGLIAASSQIFAQSSGNTDSYGAYGSSSVPVQTGTNSGYSGTVAPTAVGANTVSAPRPITARAGRWATEIRPFAEAQVTYSDNINLAARGQEESDTVLTATAGIVASAQNSRFAGQLSYAASYDKYLNDTNDDGFRHNLSTNWSATVVPNLLYLDASGGVTEVYVDADDRFSGNPVAGSGDRSRAFYGQVSPSLRRNIGGWVNAELRYGLRGEAYDDDTIDGSHSHLYRASVQSDPNKFRRFGWGAATEFEDFRRGGDNNGGDRTRWTSYVSVDVPVTRTVAVTGTAGYDRFSDDVGRDNLDGAYGNVGLRWQPNARTGISTYAGYRYNGADYGVNGTYALSDNLVAGVAAGRSVQFTEFAVPNGNTQGVNNAVRANLLTGQGNALNNPNFSIQSEDAIVDNVVAQLNGSTGKTSYNMALQAQKRDFGNGIPGETVVSADFGVSRNLTSRIAMDLGAGYSRFDVEGDNVDDFDTLALGAGLSYQLTEIVNVFGRYTYTERFADSTVDEFKENAGVVGVTASF